jgi:hypothetical protein
LCVRCGQYIRGVSVNYFQLNMSVFISDLKNRKISFLHNKVAV